MCSFAQPIRLRFASEFLMRFKFDLLLQLHLLKDVIEGPDGKYFIALGCYKDATRLRALPEMVANMRGKINWNDMEKVVKDCAHNVVLKNSTYKV